MSPRRRKVETGLERGVYRHGRGFRVRIYVDGKPKWHRLKATTESEANQEAKTVREPPPGTLAEAFKRYIERTVPQLIERGDMKPTTWRTESRRVERLISIYGHMHPHEITAVLLYELPEHIGDGWRLLKRFSAVWRYLIRWGMATHDPFLRFDWPKSRARTRYVTDDELAAALAVARKAGDEGWYSAYYVWAWLRMIELLGRRVTDIRRLALTQIVDEEGIKFTESKTGKVTLVEWSPAVGAALAEIKAVLHRDTTIRPIALICNRKGQALTEGAMNQAMQRLRPKFIEAGIPPFQPRDLRAKYGTEHPDGHRATRHTSEAVFRRHYERLGKPVKPAR